MDFGGEYIPMDEGGYKIKVWLLLWSSTLLGPLAVLVLVIGLDKIKSRIKSLEIPPSVKEVSKGLLYSVSQNV